MIELGCLYGKLVVHQSHRMNWLNYVNIKGGIPSSLFKGLEELSNELNSKYSKELLMPFRYRLNNNSCVISPDLIEAVAYEYFIGMKKVLNDFHDGLGNYFRVEWMVDEFEEDDIKSATSLDEVGSKSQRNYLLLANHFGASDVAIPSNLKPGLFEV